MNRCIILLVSFSFGCSSSDPFPVESGEVNLVNLVAPTPFAAKGKTYLVYEIQIQNVGNSPVTFQSVSIKYSNQEIANYNGIELSQRLENGKSMLMLGEITYLFLWLEVSFLHIVLIVLLPDDADVLPFFPTPITY